MLKTSRLIAAKDLRLVLGGGGGLAQALLLGLLLIFLFSLSQPVGEPVSGLTASVLFWLASAFCQVLIFNTLYGLEENNQARTGLLLLSGPVQAVWLGKALAGFVLLLAAQALFLPASMIFLGQNIGESWYTGLQGLVLADIGMVSSGSLLGALSRGQAGRESLLTLLLFPLLTPLLLAGIQLGSGAFTPTGTPGTGMAGQAAGQGWLGLAAAFDAVFLAVALMLFPFVFRED